MFDFPENHRATEPPVALSIQGLVKEFKPSRDFYKKHPERLTDRGLVRAVDGVTLEAQSGQVTVLLGSNGAGKTTTLSCAQGLLPATSGTVRLLGEDPWKASPELRARVGIMLQDGGLPQSMHPISLLKHISHLYANPLPLEPIVERLAIDSFNGTTIRRLSGGQKQRVSLAAALLANPDVLFLDEPSAGLDPQSRNVVFKIIREQKQAGKAIILTTHLLDDAQRLADYIYIIEHGTNVRQGTVPELLENPQDHRQSLTFTVSRTDLTLSDVLGTQACDVELQNLTEGKYLLTGVLTPHLLETLMHELGQLDLMPQTMELAPRTLEDVFLDISGRDIR